VTEKLYGMLLSSEAWERIKHKAQRIKLESSSRMNLWNTPML
jgi:hypothetical protein